MINFNSGYFELNLDNSNFAHSTTPNNASFQAQGKAPSTISALMQSVSAAQNSPLQQNNNQNSSLIGVQISGEDLFNSSKKSNSLSLRRTREGADADLTHEEKDEMEDQELFYPGQQATNNAKALQSVVFSPAITFQAVKREESGNNDETPCKSQQSKARSEPGSSCKKSRFSEPPPQGDTPDKIREYLGSQLSYSKSDIQMVVGEIEKLADETHRRELFIRLSSRFLEEVTSGKGKFPYENVYQGKEVRSSLHPVYNLTHPPKEKQEHVNHAAHKNGGIISGGHFVSCYPEQKAEGALKTTEAGISYFRDKKNFKTCFPEKYENIKQVLSDALNDEEKVIAVGTLKTGSFAHYVRLSDKNNNLAFVVVQHSKTGERVTIYPLYCMHMLNKGHVYKVGEEDLTYKEIDEEIKRQRADTKEKGFIFHYKNIKGDLCEVIDVGPAFKERTGIPTGVCFIVKAKMDLLPPPLNLGMFQLASATSAAAATH